MQKKSKIVAHSKTTWNKSKIAGLMHK